ncbi:MAG: hypothetical protein U9Q76_01370 [candidate division WOR-3 bacterium]|nr:hypothetical protein [candidate division WOR-3 bacterium]
MKRIIVLALSLTACLALVQTACEDSKTPRDTSLVGKYLDDYPPVENLGFVLIDEGAAVELTWDPPIGAEPEEYLVVLDSTEEISTTADWQDVHTPCALVEVYAVYPEGRSEPRVLHFRAVETAELVLWATEYYPCPPCPRTEIIPGLAEQQKSARWKVEVRSTDHPNPDDPAGFGFAEDGSAIAYDLSDTTTWPYVDFFIVDFGGGSLAIAGSEVHEPPLNDRMNGVTDPLRISYEDLNLAPPSDGYYNYSDIMAGGVYALWIDVYEADAHYAKLRVMDVDGFKVTLKLACQTVAGLRWLVAEKHVTGIKED